MLKCTQVTLWGLCPPRLSHRRHRRSQEPRSSLETPSDSSPSNSPSLTQTWQRLHRGLGGGDPNLNPVVREATRSSWVTGPHRKEGPTSGRTVCPALWSPESFPRCLAQPPLWDSALRLLLATGTSSSHWDVPAPLQSVPLYSRLC